MSSTTMQSFGLAFEFKAKWPFCKKNLHMMFNISQGVYGGWLLQVRFSALVLNYGQLWPLKGQLLGASTHFGPMFNFKKAHDVYNPTYIIRVYVLY